MKKLLQSQKDNKDVVQLSFTTKEVEQLEWEEESEFCYRGDMYDVIEKITHGDDVIIRCIPDKKETALLNEYQKQNKQHSSNSVIVQLLTAHFVLPSGYLPSVPQKMAEQKYVLYSSSLQNTISTIYPQPPDVCFYLSQNI
jgi:hypothetical protein